MKVGRKNEEAVIDVERETKIETEGQRIKPERKYRWFHKKRLLMSLTAGLTAALLMNPGTVFFHETPSQYAGAWWGCLYPKFCFAQREETGKTPGKLKFSFWFGDKWEEWTTR